MYSAKLYTLSVIVTLLACIYNNHQTFSGAPHILELRSTLFGYRCLVHICGHYVSMAILDQLNSFIMLAMCCAKA